MVISAAIAGGGSVTDAGSPSGNSELVIALGLQPPPEHGDEWLDQDGLIASVPTMAYGGSADQLLKESAAVAQFLICAESTDADCSPYSRSTEATPFSADASSGAEGTCVTGTPFVAGSPGHAAVWIPNNPFFTNSSPASDDWRPPLGGNTLRRPLPRLPMTQPALSRNPKIVERAPIDHANGAVMTERLAASTLVGAFSSQDGMPARPGSPAGSGSSHPILAEFGNRSDVLSDRSPSVIPVPESSSSAPASANNKAEGALEVAANLLAIDWFTAVANVNRSAGDDPSISLPWGVDLSNGDEEETQAVRKASSGASPPPSRDHVGEATGSLTFLEPGIYPCPGDHGSNQPPTPRHIRPAQGMNANHTSPSKPSEKTRKLTELGNMSADAGPAQRAWPGLSVQDLALELPPNLLGPDDAIAGISKELLSTLLPALPGPDLPFAALQGNQSLAGPIRALLDQSTLGIQGSAEVVHQSTQSSKPDDSVAELLKLLQRNPELTSKLAAAMQLINASQSMDLDRTPVEAATPSAMNAIAPFDGSPGSPPSVGVPSDSLLGTPNLPVTNLPHSPMWDKNASRSPATSRDGSTQTPLTLAPPGASLRNGTSQRATSASGTHGLNPIRLPPNAISRLQIMEPVTMDGSYTSPNFPVSDGLFHGGRFGQGTGSTGSLTPSFRVPSVTRCGARGDFSSPAASADRFMMAQKQSMQHVHQQSGGFGGGPQYGSFQPGRGSPSHTGNARSHSGNTRRDRYASMDGLLPLRSNAPEVMPGDDYELDDAGATNRSRLLREFRLGRIKLQNLYQLENHMVEFACDQMGARFIQQRLANCISQEVWFARNQLVPHTKMLVTDVFGNHVIQRLLEIGSGTQRHQIFLELEGDILRFALQTYGCRVLQKALESLSLEDRCALAAGLRNHVMCCVEDQNGNHVIQKVIERLPPAQSCFVLEAFRGQVARVSMHCYGCRVIQRALEHCPHEKTGPMLDEIMQHCAQLSQDQYGNYVMQHVLRYGRESDKLQIVDWIAADLLVLSSHKFSSNVVEKCLEFCSAPEARRKLIGAVFGDPSNPRPPIMQMVRDRYANYVVQRMLDVASREESDTLVSEIIAKLEKHMPALRKFTYGKHIAATLERLRKQNDERLRNHAGYGRGEHDQNGHSGSLSPMDRAPPPPSLFDSASPATTVSTSPMNIAFHSGSSKYGNYQFMDSPPACGAVPHVGLMMPSPQLASGHGNEGCGRFGVRR